VFHAGCKQIDMHCEYTISWGGGGGDDLMGQDGSHSVLAVGFNEVVAHDGHGAP